MKYESHLLVGVPDDHDGGLVLVHPVEEGGQGHPVLIGGVSWRKEEIILKNLYCTTNLSYLVLA